ncbi:MAG: Hpt domain-containing protein [Comamonadaceae bacterium]|nr:Hpt domain-containing protein [Comamonadaceae bacterium]
MRQLHTVKGSARMAGAMRLGELVHDMETRIESAMQLRRRAGRDRRRPARPATTARWRCTTACSTAARAGRAAALPRGAEPPAGGAGDRPAAARASATDGRRRAERRRLKPPRAMPPRSSRAARRRPRCRAAAAGAAGAVVHPRARRRARQAGRPGRRGVDRALASSRTNVGTIKGSLADLTENIQRLRTQLREVEIQAEAQIAGARRPAVDATRRPSTRSSSTATRACRN